MLPRKCLRHWLIQLTGPTDEHLGEEEKALR
jgi:hypothetical protein